MGRAQSAACWPILWPVQAMYNGCSCVFILPCGLYRVRTLELKYDLQQLPLMRMC